MELILVGDGCHRTQAAVVQEPSVPAVFLCRDLALLWNPQLPYRISQSGLGILLQCKERVRSAGTSLVTETRWLPCPQCETEQSWEGAVQFCTDAGAAL